MPKKIFPTHCLLIAVALMPALHFLWAGGILLPMPWNLVGLIPLAAGIGINLAADRDLHKAGTTVKPDEESAALVTGGAYRISRNPMYLGFVLLLAGIALLLGSLTPWIVVPAFALLMDRTFIAAEERMLEARFGAEWKAYQTAVRRWV
jgi:protein-S-isoprenylcysteine O-methyltransferase Ste14